MFHFPTFFDFQVVLLDSGAILGQMNCDFFSEFSETIWRGRPGPFSKMAATQWTICRNCPNWFFFQYGVENLILRNIKMRHFFLKWIFHIFQIFWSSDVGCRERPKIKVFVIFRYFLSFLQIAMGLRRSQTDFEWVLSRETKNKGFCYISVLSFIFTDSCGWHFLKSLLQ